MILLFGCSQIQRIITAQIQKIQIQALVGFLSAITYNDFLLELFDVLDINGVNYNKMNNEVRADASLASLVWVHPNSSRK